MQESGNKWKEYLKQNVFSMYLFVVLFTNKYTTKGGHHISSFFIFVSMMTQLKSGSKSQTS